MTLQETKNSKGYKLRIGRHSEPNRTYLITTVTHKREPIFTNIYLGRAVINTMQAIEQQGLLNSQAFVVMPDHIHWLFQLNEKKPLPEAIRQFKGLSAFHINKARDRENIKVWQSGYHDHAVRKEEDIKSIARYIIANPLRTSLADSVRDYPLWDAVWL